MRAGDVLYYVADPMCSWCWGFAPQLERVVAEVPQGVELRYVMGGLAPDSDEPMPDEVRSYVQGAWRAVTETTGAVFDWDFWERCAPRRSTYPACRAVLAAGDRGPELFARIQRAYYAEARNPSDADTLVACAADLGLDPERFAADLASPEVDARLAADLVLRAELGIEGMPSLVHERRLEGNPGGGSHQRRLALRGFATAEAVLARLAD